MDEELAAAIKNLEEQAEACERIASKLYGPNPMPEFGQDARAIRIVLAALAKAMKETP